MCISNCYDGHIVRLKNSFTGIKLLSDGIGKHFHHVLAVRLTTDNQHIARNYISAMRSWQAFFSDKIHYSTFSPQILHLLGWAIPAKHAISATTAIFKGWELANDSIWVPDLDKQKCHFGNRHGKRK